jgi:IMP dehydrogenase
MAHVGKSKDGGSVLTEDEFYQAADLFFRANLPFGLTFDDVTLATNYSEILPREVYLETQISDRLSLPIPIISSDMDTVTESRMAIAMALNGGMGLIHYNMPESQQTKEVARVKNHIHGLIQDPITVHPAQVIGDILQMIQDRNFEFRTFPVVQENGKLAGLLSGRKVKERYRDFTVMDAMIPREKLLVIQESDLGNQPINAADRFFDQHIGIHKLLVVNSEDRLKGLFTLSDIDRIKEEAGSLQKPARDDEFRLVCGAAISSPRKENGQLDRDRILAQVTHLVDEGVDAIAVSTAHGHTIGVGETVALIRGGVPDLTIIAGNVTSAEGVRFLSERGADAVKVGQGPGSICTTRVIAGVGIPQLSALYVASRNGCKRPPRILADGGITKSGDIVKAMTIADAVVCGGVLAGCRESPGKIVDIGGKLYKEYRGMGSLSAMKDGSAARYGHDRPHPTQKFTAEGIEALKEVAGSVDEVLSQLVGGLQSGMGYLGAENLATLKAKARYIRVTPAGQRESTPHDVTEVKTPKEPI